MIHEAMSFVYRHVIIIYLLMYLDLQLLPWVETFPLQ